MLLRIFAQSYKIYKELNQAFEDNKEEIQKNQQEKIKPLFEEMKSWIEQESLEGLPKSQITKGMWY